MIAAAMAYMLAMTLLLTLSAAAIERFLALTRRTRRGVWALALAASLIVPGIALFSTDTSAPQSDAAGPSVLGHVVGESATYARLMLEWSTRSEWDQVLIGLWALTSVGALLFLATIALRLQRSLRRWPTLPVNGRQVSIAEDIGPAVFGIFNPRIILPRWLLDAHPAVRSAVLEHERAHICGRDPLLLSAALLLVALMPWNLPLWWQLRRLRFAIEVDCDARVLREQIDPTVYGEALLSVCQRRSSMPLATIAMTEPASQLERRIRIMLLERSRYYLVFSGAFLALAATFIACAARLEPPSIVHAAELTEQSLGEKAIDAPMEESAAVESYFPASLRFTVPAVIDDGSEPSQQSSGMPSEQ